MEKAIKFRDFLLRFHRRESGSLGERLRGIETRSIPTGSPNSIPGRKTISKILFLSMWLPRLGTSILSGRLFSILPRSEISWLLFWMDLISQYKSEGFPFPVHDSHIFRFPSQYSIHNFLSGLGFFGHFFSSLLLCFCICHANRSISIFNIRELC